VAVQVGVLVNPLIVQVWGEAVETLCAPSTTVPPPVHVTVTLTEAAFAGTHTLLTVKVVVVCGLLMVQEPALSGALQLFTV
jgi:hypothetical protein